MNRKQIFFFIGVIFFLIFILIMIYSGERRGSNEYFRNLNLVLTGIVTDKQVVSNNSGMLYVDVRYTSIPEYDVRGRVSDYYCVIHKGKAEIIEGGMYDIHIGDSLVINSKIDSFESFRNDKIIEKRRLHLIYFETVKSMIQRYHRL